MASGDDFGSRRKIPVRLNDFNVLDSEFDNIRQKKILMGQRIFV
jgi:hypothetical protein